MHKKLTFSEFYGSSYETEISHKFVEYLKLCFRMCYWPIVACPFSLQITLARESRQHYTLNPIPGMTVAPPLPSTAPAIITPLPTALTIPVPRVSSAEVLSSIGPIRTTHKTRLHHTRINRRIPANTTSPMDTVVPQVEASEANITQAQPQVNLPEKITLPSDSRHTDATSTEPDAPVATPAPAECNVPVVVPTPGPNTPIAATTPDGIPAAEVPNDDASDSMSYTSTLPDIFDVGSDDSAPPATGPWIAIDHLTGEMIVDEDQPTSPAPAVPAMPALTNGPPLVRVEVAIARPPGGAYLVETPAALLSEDEDVRPEWLMTAVNTFLRFVPCVGGLGKVIDLFLKQEARFGYPRLVRTLALLNNS